MGKPRLASYGMAGGIFDAAAERESSSDLPSRHYHFLYFSNSDTLWYKPQHIVNVVEHWMHKIRQIEKSRPAIFETQ